MSFVCDENFGSGTFTDSTAARPSSHVITGKRHLGLRGNSVCFHVLIEGTRDCGTQSGQMGAAIALRDVVRETQNVLLIGIVPLQRCLDAISAAFRVDMEDRWIEPRFVAVQILDEGADSAVVLIYVPLSGSLVGQNDSDPGVEKCELSQPSGEKIVVKFDIAEGTVAWREPEFGTGPVGFSDYPQVGYRLAVTILLKMSPSVSPDPKSERRRKRIDHRNPDSVETARYLVGVLVEFSSCVEDGHDDFGRRTPFLRMKVHGNAPTVVTNRYRFTLVNCDLDFSAMPGERFIDRIVDGLEDEVVKAGSVIGIADEHSRTFSDGF